MLELEGVVERRGATRFACSLRLIAVDKIRTPYIAEAAPNSASGSQPYFSYDEIEVRPRTAAIRSAAMREEASASSSTAPRRPRLAARAHRDAAFRARTCARESTRSRTTGISRLTFVVAGTYGADACAARARRHALVALAADVLARVGARDRAGTTLSRGEDRAQ